MKMLQRIWEDIRQGENIDLYVTATIAIVLTALNIVGLAPQSWIAPISLAVLGLLAIATLGNRYKMEQVIQKLTQNAWRVSSLRIYEHWNVREVYDAVGSAKQSVVIVESWISEASVLSSYIKSASQYAGKPVQLLCYMLDPDSPFGAQRCAEVNCHSGDPDAKWSEKYRQKFDDAVRTFSLHLSRANVDMVVHKYASIWTFDNVNQAQRRLGSNLYLFNPTIEPIQAAWACFLPFTTTSLRGRGGSFIPSGRPGDFPRGLGVRAGVPNC